MVNENVLAMRYATKTRDIFSDYGKNLAERKLWVAVMKSEAELGLNIPAEDIGAYEAVVEDIDLALIKKLDIEIQHDVKAKIKAFNIAAEKAAGRKVGQHCHRGMTSRDLTDNVEQKQFLDAGNIILGRNVSQLRHLTDRAKLYRDRAITARTHNVAAQLTLLGRRFSMYAEELMENMEDFEHFLGRYPLRGIKGPVGTQFDMLSLLGSEEKVTTLENKVAELLGFKRVLHSPGQVYPRSLDYRMVTRLAALASAPQSFAKTMRLMAGYQLVDEGFDEEQTGSSIMAHKKNAKNCERVCGFSELLKMYADGASRISGDQWQEGDVSCSAVRRVVMPDAFYTSDGLLETSLTILNKMQAYDGAIEGEIGFYMPFLCSTDILSKATKAGIGREDAHAIIKKHAVAELARMQRTGSADNNLFNLIAQEPAFVNAGITKDQLDAIGQNREKMFGNAKAQIDSVIESSQYFISKYSQEASYEPGPIP